MAVLLWEAEADASCFERQAANSNGPDKTSLGPTGCPTLDFPKATAQNWL